MPNVLSAWKIIAQVLDFPFVPVMPIRCNFLSGWLKKFADISASAALAFSTFMQSASSGSPVSCSHMNILAPRSYASRAYLCPSETAPRIHTKSAPPEAFFELYTISEIAASDISEAELYFIPESKSVNLFISAAFSCIFHQIRREVRRSFQWRF